MHSEQILQEFLDSVSPCNRASRLLFVDQPRLRERENPETEKSKRAGWLDTERNSQKQKRKPVHYLRDVKNLAEQTPTTTRISRVTHKRVSCSLPPPSVEPGGS